MFRFFHTCVEYSLLWLNPFWYNVPYKTLFLSVDVGFTGKQSFWNGFFNAISIVNNHKIQKT